MIIGYTRHNIDIVYLTLIYALIYIYLHNPIKYIYTHIHVHISCSTP